jgi:hypothetical protein
MVSELAFRNIDASPTDPVESWPYEGLVTAIERGSLSDWRRIAAAVRRAPWGPVARGLEEYATYGEETGVAELMVEAVRRARAAAERADKAEVSARVRAAVERSGLAARRFAAEVGTSASRLSTYGTGAVQPSAAMLLRIERESQRLAADHDADTGRHNGRGRGHP